MAKTKRNTYKQGINRIDQALDEGFWLEAAWITYAMFEDRCDSLLSKSGGPVPLPPNRKFVAIDTKITVLKKRSKTDEILSKVSELPALLSEVKRWKNRRNPIMHSMVNLPKDWSLINADAKILAEEGREILGRYAAAAMKVRKKYKRSGK